MKRYGNIYEKVIKDNNIRMAFIESINNSKKKNRKDIQYKLNNMDYYMRMLQNNFHISGKYTTKIIISKGENNYAIWKNNLYEWYKANKWISG